MASRKFYNLLCRIRNLHIEIAFKNFIDNWLEGSNWNNIYAFSGIISSERIIKLLKVMHVKKSTYAFQVTQQILFFLMIAYFQAVTHWKPFIMGSNQK